MSEHVYKVVTRTPYDRYYSYMYFSLGGSEGYGIEYKIGVTSYPKLEGSAIYAFDSIDSVFRFVGHRSLKRLDVVTLECEYCKSDVPPNISMEVAKHYVEMFWSKNGLSVTARAPFGTVMCEWVKPIRIVEVYDE